MDRACFAYEVTAIRQGQLTLMHDDFSREEADDIIVYLVTWFSLFFIFIFFVSNAISAYISVFFFLSSVFMVCSCVLRVQVLYLMNADWETDGCKASNHANRQL